jgi:HAD superfamily hydrolase (TIGR01662 family)
MIWRAMEKPKAVLLDWDGTLYDSTQLCFEIYEELFRRFKVKEISLQEFRQDFSADYHTYQKMHGIGKDAWEKFDDAWDGVYLEKKGKAKIFENSVPTLQALRKLKVPVGLVTNATKGRIASELSSLKIKHYFDAVVTIEDADWQFKPSPKLIEIACGQLNISAEHCIYVGDMIEDVMAGKAAGALTGVVATGVHTLDKLLKEEPDFIFSDISEVLTVL